MSRREERLASLAAYLSHVDHPRSLAEIRDVFAAYAEGEAGRQMFIRDKRELLAAGLPVVEIDDRYWIPRAELHVEQLELDHAERAALNVALLAVPLLDLSMTALGAALGGFGDPSSTAPIHADLEPLAELPALHAAARERRLVELDYGGRRRQVEPFGLVFRNGVWYLVARDRADRQQKSFRVGRIAGSVAVVTGPGAFDRPEGFDLSESLPDPWELPGDEPVEAVVRIAAALADKVLDDLSNVDHARREDGSVDLRLEVTHQAALRAWVLALLDHAEVIAPEELRSDMRTWLRAIVEAPA